MRACGVSGRQVISRQADDEESDKTMSKTAKEGKAGESPSQLIDARIAALSDWRGETLARVRMLRRAIDIHEGDKIDENALKALIRAAVALNTSKQAAARPVRSRKKPKSA